jgi:DNA-binding beta-propeller fold protein YncE
MHYLRAGIVALAILALGPFSPFATTAALAGPGPAPAPVPGAVGPSTERVAITGYLERNEPHQVRYVSVANGSDHAGDGSRSRPWASVRHALASIGDARLSNRYALLVAAGTYAEGGLQARPFIDLWGGFDPATWERDVWRYRTVLDGRGRDRILTAADHMRVDGFVFTGGAARGPGGAILCNGVSPVISNNRFLSNRTLQPAGWSPEFLHEVANDGGAVAAINGAAPTIRNNLFAFNTTEAGRGAAVAAHNRAAPVIMNNVMVQNTAGTNDPMRSSDGGAISAARHSRAVVHRNVITGNRALSRNDGGGIFAELWAALELDGNIVAGNYADDDGGGLFLAGQQHHYITEPDEVPPPESYLNIIHRNVFMGNSTRIGDQADDGAMRVTNQARLVVAGNVVAFNRGGARFRRTELTAADNIFVDGFTVVESWRPALLCANLVIGELTLDPGTILDSLDRRGRGDAAGALARLLEADGAELRVASAAFDEYRVQTTLRLSAKPSLSIQPGRVIRAGDEWAVVHSASGSDVVVWGQLDRVDRVQLVPSLKPTTAAMTSWGTGQHLHAPCGHTLSSPFVAAGSWGRLPEGRSWGAVNGVALDSMGHIWALDRCGSNTCVGSDLDPIMKFDADGNLLASFGGGLFAWPHGFFIDDNDNIWVTDASGHWIPGADPLAPERSGKGHMVMKFSPSGQLLLTLGTPGVAGSGPRHFRNPSDVVVSPGGDIFVVDGHKPDGNHRVVRFSATGEFITEWGRRGIGAGEFEEPHAIALDSRGRVFVADRINNRIQLFTRDGEFLEQWTQFGRPSGIFIDADDVMYVADSESNAGRNPGWERGIRIGSARDGWVRYFIPDPEPDPDRSGTSGAEFVTADRDGNVFAAEVGPRDLKLFVRLRDREP